MIRVVISGMPGQGPIAFESLRAVLVVGSDADPNGGLPTLARGSKGDLVACVATALNALERHSGKAGVEEAIQLSRTGVIMQDLKPMLGIVDGGGA